MTTIYLTLDKAKSFWQSGNEILAKIALKAFSRKELESEVTTRRIELTQEEYNELFN
jgi:propanediol utilization protein